MFHGFSVWNYTLLVSLCSLPTQSGCLWTCSHYQNVDVDSSLTVDFCLNYFENGCNNHYYYILHREKSVKKDIKMSAVTKTPQHFYFLLYLTLLYTSKDVYIYHNGEIGFSFSSLFLAFYCSEICFLLNLGWFIWTKHDFCQVN